MYKPEIDGVTQSLLIKKRECPVKCRAHLKGLFLPGNSDALIYGNVFHEYQDVVLTLVQSKEINSWEYFQDKNNMRKVTAEVYKRFEKEIEESELKFKDSYMQTFEIMKYLIPLYFRFWQNDFSGKEKKTIYEVEKIFKVPFAGSFLRGKRDFVFSQRSADNLYLSDHKTKSRIEENLLSMLIPRDFQVLFYMLAYYLEYGKKLKGVLYNIVRKTSLRRKVSEGIEQFAKRIASDIESRPEFYFIRYHVDIQWKNVALFSLKLGREIKEFIEWYNNPECKDIPYTNNCSTKFGSCEFLEYCDSNFQSKEYLSKGELFKELKERK